MSTISSAIMTQAQTMETVEDRIVEVIPTPEESGSVQMPTNILPIGSKNNVAVAKSLSALEHEEGEIEGTDEEMGVLEYEDISSEEEFSIRERIAQLEAMDSEISQLTGNENRRLHVKDKLLMTVQDGKENFECISDDEDVELYLNRYEPVPKPKLLPTRRTLRPSRSVSQSLRSGIKRHISERSRRKVAKRKHGQSALRKASLHRRHKRRKHTVSSSVVNVKDSSDSEADFPLDRARLQAACNINSRKRKTDKENWDALKQKLKLSIQRRRKKSESYDVEIVQNDPVILDDDDDEDEEVLQLRLQALKTKAEVKDTGFIDLMEDSLPQKTIAEEQELRLLALQSTFTKKHQIRLQKRQADRPYSPSDDIPLLLSPAEEYPISTHKITNIDDDIQIIETQPETVEIIDSSSENEDQMDLSPTESTESPKSPDEKPKVVSSTICQSPSSEIHSDQYASIETTIPEPPPPPIIGNIKITAPEDEDEEALRNQLLSTLSASTLKSSSNLPTSRPLTPDSMVEEEAEALRELILSKMHKKVTTKHLGNAHTSPQAAEFTSQDDAKDIPHEISAAFNEPSTDLIDTSQTGAVPLSSVATSNMSINQSRAPINPNLITLIGKQKITRKKRKKSQTAIQNRAAKKALATLAVVVPPPARTLVKATVVQLPPPMPLSLPLVSTTKLVNNPNKLINLNAPLLVHSPKERSATVETFVQKPVRKLIIQVGNSDSDSDSDYYPVPDTEPAPRDVERLRDSFLRDIDNASPSRIMLESPAYSPVPIENNTEQDGGSLVTVEPPMITTKASDSGSNQAAFEQRLDHFLKSVRSKIDNNQKASNCGDATLIQADVIPPVGGSSVGLGAAENVPKRLTIASIPTTPSAVRHLPKSAQLEYKRLVARMAQLERQKQIRMVVVNKERITSKRPPPLTKTIVNTGSLDVGASKNHELVVTVNHDKRDVLDMSNPSTISRNNVASMTRDCDTLFKRVLINNTVIAESKTNPQDDTAQTQQKPFSSTKTKDDSSETNTELPLKESKEKTYPASPNRIIGAAQTDQEISTLREALRRLSTIKEEDRKRVLSIAEYRSEKHSQKFHKELQDLIVTVENAQHERQKQYDLENKVAFLKEKLMVLERALTLHKGRIAQLFPALQQSHSKVMQSRKKSMELNNLCLEIGRIVEGQSYDTPSTVRNEIHEQLKILTTETKRLKNMKRLSFEEFKKITADHRQQQLEKRQKSTINETLLEASQNTISTTEQITTITQTTVTEEQSYDQQLIETEIVSNQQPKTEPTLKSTSPSTVLNQSREVSLQKASVTQIGKQTCFATYSSPLVSLKDQSALNIPDGVICPYQMRGECVDQDCKFEHFQ